MKRPDIAKWEVRFAAASGFVYIAAVLVIAIPALTHHGEVPHREHLIGIILMATAVAMFFASVVTSFITTSEWYYRHRRNR